MCTQVSNQWLGQASEAANTSAIPSGFRDWLAWASRMLRARLTVRGATETRVHPGGPVTEICDAGTVPPETFCRAPCLQIDADRLERLIDQGALKPGDFRCLDAASRNEVAAMAKRCTIRALARSGVTNN